MPRVGQPAPLDPHPSSAAGRRAAPAWRLAVTASALLGLAAAYVALAVDSLTQKSVTVDEFGHLPAGYNALTTGDLDYCELNPPLINVLCALPVAAMNLQPSGPELPLEPQYRHSFWANGYAFQSRFRADYQRAFVAGRCVTVALVGGLGVLAFFWARQLARRQHDLAGLLAAALIWFTPQMLADATLVTTDAGLTALTGLTMYTLHLFLRRPGWWRAALVGVALGLAQIAKFSAVYLYPVVLLVWLVWLTRQTGPLVRRGLLTALLMLAVSGLTINAGYLFQKTLRPIGGLPATSKPLGLLQRLLPAGTPLPLPEAYVLAFDRQLYYEHIGDPAYLLGRHFHGGCWYFYLVLLAIKTPLPLLAIGMLALAIAWKTRRGASPGMSGQAMPGASAVAAAPYAPEALLLLLPATVFLLVFSLLSNKQMGLRLILPGAGPLAVWLAVTLTRVQWRWPMTALMTGLVGWWAAETLRIHPHYLAYFNLIAGGPQRGYLWATGSNVDWGQDLIGLRRWMDRHDVRSIQLLYFGRVDPEIYGIEYVVPRGGIRPGLVAVGLSFVGRPFFLNDHGQATWFGPIRLDPRIFGQPLANIGYSMHVYRLERFVPEQEYLLAPARPRSP